MLFQNPWRDPALPSWVAEEGGRIVGFMGIVPRRMLLHGKPVRVAVGCQFMVDPDERHSLTALQLLRKFMSGPQDIALADGAREEAGRLWKAAGGRISALYGLHWVRVLRPARSLLQLIASRGRLGRLAFLGAPMASLVDVCATRYGPLRPKPQLDEEELDARALLAGIEDVSKGLALRPSYDLGTLEWLLEQVKTKKRHGAFHGRLVREPDGRVAGWFMYYLNGRMSQVVQIGARTQRFEAVLEQLFHHAWSRGAVALEGRMEPRLARVLSERHCFFHDRASVTLIHARDPAMLHPLVEGDAFFSRLEGEWWMRFSGDVGADGTFSDGRGRRAPARVVVPAH